MSRSVYSRYVAKKKKKRLKENRGRILPHELPFRLLGKLETPVFGRSIFFFAVFMDHFLTENRRARINTFRRAERR